jgi:hypothetical protein
MNTVSRFSVPELSNPIANLTARRPNEEFYTMGRGGTA